MRRNTLLAFLIVTLFVGTSLILYEPGEGQFVDKFNGSGGIKEDFVVLKGDGQTIFDSHLYLELEKNVPISEASMKISTVNSENGPWINQPKIDIGLDGNPEWEFSGTGYGDFGRTTSFADDSIKRTNTYTGSQNKVLNSVLLPEDAEVHSSGMSIRGRFEPQITSMSTLASGGAINYIPNYIRVGDVTGDNISDAIIGTGRPGRLYLYKQTSDRSYDVEDLNSISSSVYDYLIFDVDDDDDNDIVYATSTGLFWTENNGTGYFTSAHLLSSSISSYLLEAADMDGDGEDEILVARQSFSFSTNRTSIYMLKRTSGSSFDAWPIFNTGSGSGTSNINFLKVGDWNNDDYLDIYGAFSNNRVYTIENPGYHSYFNDTSNISTKTKWDIDNVLSESYPIYGFDVGDVDNDGYADVVTAPYYYYGSNIKYWRNRGSSTWTSYNLVSGYIYYPRSCSLSDLNGDGYLDVFYSAGSYYYNNRIGWLDGKKSPNKSGWTDNQLMTGQDSYGVNCFAGDLDSDGYDDAGLFFNTNRQCIVWYNSDPYDGTKVTPGFVEDGGLVGLSDLEICDVDQDGDDDFFATAYNSGTVGWFENDGTPFSGQWNFNRINGVMVSGAREIAWGDIDGDGDFDAAVTSYSSGNVMWFENPGNPRTIWEVHHVGSMTYINGVGVADLDEDGIMEIVVSPGYYYSNTIKMFYTDDPDGTWRSHSISSSVSYCGVINMTDMNNDGHIDVLVPINGYSGSAQIYRNPLPLNPRTSAWTSISAASGLQYPHEAVPYDIDGNGVLDVVVTQNYQGVKWGKAPSNANATGGWQSFALSSGNNPSYSWGVEVDDVDHDGFADVFVTSRYMWDSTYTYGRGVYWFEEPDNNEDTWQKRNLDTSMGGTYGVAVADLDNDDVIEIFALSSKDHVFKVSRPSLHYPSDVIIDLGNDGVNDWTWSGNLRGIATVDLSDELQYVLNTKPAGASVSTDPHGNRMMTIPIYIRTSTRGRLTGYGFEARYNVTLDIENGGKFKDELTRIIPDYNDPDDPIQRVYILFSGRSEGTAFISDLSVEYNAPPKMKTALPTKLTVQEDSLKRNVLDLSNYFIDDYDPAYLLSYRARVVGVNNDKVDVYIENGANVTIDSTITKDFDRETWVEFVIEDNGGPGGVPSRRTITNRIKIDVLPVDDPPVLGNDTLPLNSKFIGSEGEEVMVADLGGLNLFYDPDDPLGINILYYPILDFEKTYPQDISGVSVRLTKDKKLYVKSEGDWYGLNIPLRIYGHDDLDVNLLEDPYHSATIDIINVNDPPIFNEIPSVTVDEDIRLNNILDLSPYAEDMDTAPLELVYHIISQTNATHYRVEQDQNDKSKIHVRPLSDNWNGIVDVDVLVTDGEFSATSTFRIFVEPLNDQPWVVIKDPIENRGITESEFSVVGEAHDVEGIEKVEVKFEGQWYTTLGKNTWGLTLITPVFEEMTSNVPIQVKVTDTDGSVSYAYVNVTIFPPEPEPDYDFDDDGYKNGVDAFPYDPSEWLDTDYDGVGDNADAFPFNNEWQKDSDHDGIADKADEDIFDPDPPIDGHGTSIKSKDETSYALPIALFVIAILLMVLAVLSIISFIGKRNASLDPRRTVEYYNKQEKRREMLRRITGRERLEKALERMQMKEVGTKRPQLPYGASPMPMPTRAGGLPPPSPRGAQPMHVQQLPPHRQGTRMPPPPPPTRVPPRR